MEAPRGAREPTGTNGPTPHQPPNPGTHPPNGEHRHKKGRARDPQPQTPKTGPARGGRATRHPPPPPGPQTRANTRQQGGARRSRNHYTNHDQPTPPPRHTTGQDTPPHGGPTKGGDGRHDLVVVTAPGKRPATFRTWKLSPAAPMVLHPRGCGRVGNRHNTPPGGGPRTQARPPHTHTRTREGTQQRGHTHARQTSTHAGTRTRAHTRPRA